MKGWKKVNEEVSKIQARERGRQRVKKGVKMKRINGIKMRKKLWEVKLTAICLSLDQQQPFLHPGCMNVQSYMLKNQLTVQGILDSAIIYYLLTLESDSQCSNSIRHLISPNSDTSIQF